MTWHGHGLGLDDTLSEDCEQWRIDEREIDGGWCGCEYPRLWPPRWHEPKSETPWSTSMPTSRT